MGTHDVTPVTHKKSVTDGLAAERLRSKDLRAKSAFDLLLRKSQCWPYSQTNGRDAIGMLRSVSPYFRIFLIGVMLVLAASANLLCISYDANDQDDIPPVTVEFKFVFQAPKASPNVQANALMLPAAVLAEGALAQRNDSSVSVLRSDAVNRSPQVFLPLLC